LISNNMAALTFEELKKRQGTQEVPTPERFGRKGFARRAGEFLAPTTTGLITGEKKATLRTAFGAALEVGSFLLPTGAILKGAGFVGKGARAIGLAKKAKITAKAVKAAKVAKKAKVTEGLTFGDIQARAGQIGARLRGQAKRAALIGGVAGTGFGAGRALGEEDLSLKEVAGEAAIGGFAGAAGGAILAPAVSLIALGARGITGITSKAIRGTTKRLQPKTRQTAIESLTDAFENSFVADKAAVNNKLDTLVVKSRRVGGPLEKRGLLRELAEEGYIPKVEGELANMRPVIDDLATRRGKLANSIDEFLKPVKTKTGIKSLEAQTKKALTEDFGVDIDKTLRQSNAVFKALRTKHGSNMTAIQLNEVRKQLNKQTKAFGKEFVQDTANVIARVIRERLDELAPTTVVRGINKEIARLFRIDNTARIFHNKKIDAGIIARSIGSFIGTVGAAGAGLAVAGPGGLVIAGLAANLGGKALANMVRRSRFNPQVIQLIKNSIVRDKKLKEKLLKEVTGGDRALLVKIFSEIETPIQKRSNLGTIR
jgi:hypothetical protein